MPTFEEKTFPYELLLRFGSTDDTKGKLSGANLKYETYVYRDGVFWQSAISEPQQLALVDVETGELLSDVLGEINAQTIVDNQALAASLDAEQANTATLTEQLNAAQAEIQRLTDLLAADAATPVATEAPDGFQLQTLSGISAEVATPESLGISDFSSYRANPEDSIPAPVDTGTA